MSTSLCSPCVGAGYGRSRDTLRFRRATRRVPYDPEPISATGRAQDSHQPPLQLRSQRMAVKARLDKRAPALAELLDKIRVTLQMANACNEKRMDRQEAVRCLPGPPGR